MQRSKSLFALFLERTDAEVGDNCRHFEEHWLLPFLALVKARPHLSNRPPQNPFLDMPSPQEMENQRYFSDKRKEANMVEHWVPPEERTWQAGPKPARPLKVPKVKEPKETKETQRKCASPRVPQSLRRMASAAKLRVGETFTKLKAFYAKIRGNKVAPIHTKVQSRHLELEPLCCLSSCLVRGGCMTVVVFEMAYVAITALFVLIGMSRGGFTLWEPIPKTLNGWFGHHVFYFCIAIYDIALFLVAIGLARGLYIFNRVLLKAHFYFCFVSLAVNIAFLGFSIWALFAPGPFSFNFLNSLMIWCFSMQIPLQIWAITVVKSCFDFFGLIHVFVSLAES